MSGNLKVTFGTLEGAAGNINSGANNIQARLDALESDLAPLRSDWTGEAQGAYTAAKAKWDSAMQDIKALLAEIGGAVSQANADYQQTEKSNSSRWG